MSNLQEDTELREQINKQFTHVFVQGAANSASVLYAAASEQEDANEAGKRIQDICNKYTEEIMQLIHSRDEQRDKKPMWYICTDFIRNGGNPVVGGFETKGLALKIRHMYEKQTGKTYAVDALKPSEGKDNKG